MRHPLTFLKLALTLILSLRRHGGLTFICEYARMRLAGVCFVGATCPIRTAQAFSSAHDDPSPLSTPGFGPTDRPSCALWLNTLLSLVIPLAAAASLYTRAASSRTPRDAWIQEHQALPPPRHGPAGLGAPGGRGDS